MIAIELLCRKTSNDVPVAVLVVDVPNRSISVLRKSLLSYEVGSSKFGAVSLCE